MIAEIGAFASDLVEQARRAERPVPSEEVVVERSGPLGDEPVEPPHVSDLIGEHLLTLVKFLAVSTSLSPGAPGARVRT